MRRHYPISAVDERRRGRNIPAILLGTLFTVGTITGVVIFNPSHDEADMARASESQTSTSVSPSPSATPSNAASEDPAKANPKKTAEAESVQKSVTGKDVCPTGDLSGSDSDGRCAKPVVAEDKAPAAAPAGTSTTSQQTTTSAAQPKYDNCPNGDYTASRTDGQCGQATTTTTTVKTDNCPNGDFSGNKNDGQCGTPPKGADGVTATVTSCTYNADTKRMDMAVRVDDVNNAGYILYTQFGTYGAEPWPKTVGSMTFTDHLSNVTAKVACRAWVG